MAAQILIVDDDYDLRETIADVLQDEGLTVASAEDGLAALEYLASAPPPRVILLDWMMPGCNGAEFRTRQLADPALAAIPVVLLTADARYEEKMTALAVDAFLTKPCNRARLVETVRRYCV